MIEAAFAIPTVLILMEDEDKVIRAHAIKYAKSIIDNQSRSHITVFNSTEKPKSVNKTKQPLTPLKPSKAVLFLEELSAGHSEILQDPSQLATFLNKSKHQDVFEIVLRTLLDWPTNEIKSKLISLLSCVNLHNMVFSISLSDTLNRIYHTSMSK